MTLIACSCTARKIAYISLYYCKTAAFTIRSFFTLNRKNVIKISRSGCQSRNWEVIRNKGSSHRNVNVLRLTVVIRTENGVTVALIHMKMISRVSSLKSCCEFRKGGFQLVVAAAEAYFCYKQECSHLLFQSFKKLVDHIRTELIRDRSHDPPNFLIPGSYYVR